MEVKSSDDELVRAIKADKAGNDEAFELLFDKYKNLTAKTAYRFFSAREQVEEIIQEVFIKAWFGINDYQGGNERSFPAWLMKITVRTCYDELRRIKRRGESSLSDINENETVSLGEQLKDVSAQSNIENVAISRDLADKLLSKLRPEDRIVLTLLKVEGLSIAEIAEITGWSVAKVKMRSFRAQHSLRSLLKKYI